MSDPGGWSPEKHARRDIVDAIRYLTDNGCKWRAAPADFPPWKTVHGFFTRWKAAGVIDRIHDSLREQVRIRAGRHPQPSAGSIDSQSVRVQAHPAVTYLSAVLLIGLLLNSLLGWSWADPVPRS